ncbi:MAG: DNA mismatch repair endonuclease MutL, partial [Chloroflexota bacterium]|nr:DNA mismatch repair endonuclease MutL [Chloroflexota bacterium]
MSIEVLSPDVVAKIAAGEVVERPASVVKELVENSLDAGATRISIEARGGGAAFIKVVDNGSGIPSGQAEAAFERHATSKISSAKDLEAISTLGFRGEALPSIAVVSQIEVLTRTPDEESGVLLCLRDGKVSERSVKASPQGTSITVHNLFQNVPARLKFLKSAGTENAHISDLVTQYALAFPGVRFDLVIDGRGVLQTSGGGGQRDVLVEIYGLKTAEAMIEVGDIDSQVYGFVGPPELARSRRSHLSFFVNRRWVRSGLLTRATEEAYSGLLMSGRHPIAVLNIAIDPRDIDINVHPAKTEIKFRNEREVFADVQRAVRAALIEETAVPQSRRAPHTVSLPSSASRTEPVVRQNRLFEESSHLEARVESANAGPRLPILRVIGQMASTYIITEGPDGMYLIDQHAAHERILFERAMAQRARGAVEVQGMLEPLVVELTPRQTHLLQREEETLSSYGFAIEPFGGRSYAVRTVPAALREADIARAVIEILDSLADEGDRAKVDERIAASVACHGAVRAGKTLSQE